MNGGTVAARGPVPALAYTGERMVPEAADTFTFWEHIYRYAFACPLVAGKRVLDIACGEGYGAAALRSAGASSVIGVDISEEACLHAHQKYGIETRVGGAEQIPLPDRSIDVIVSFETIEHVRNPARFVDECARVLASGGRLLVSTPNKDVYSAPGKPLNPFHCSEMTEREFLALLAARFRRVRLYSQRPQSAAWWSPRLLASETLPRVRGVARLRQALQSRAFPRALREPTSVERSAAVEQILAGSHSRTNLLNPYALRPRAAWHREMPLYFVALATRGPE
jgi:SAM-dependent methyltransferase